MYFEPTLCDFRLNTMNLVYKEKVISLCTELIISIEVYWFLLFHIVEFEIFNE